MNNGRISSFCRYNHSQYFSFGKLSSNSFTQQFRVQDANLITYYPDIALNLSNTVQTSLKETFYNTQGQLQFGSYLNYAPDTIAFVKCSIDENFYHCPATTVANLPISNGVTKTTVLDPPIKIHVPFNPNDDDVECEMRDAVRLSRLHFTPTTAAGTQSSQIFTGLQNSINTGTLQKPYYKSVSSKLGLHVYALITMDGPVEPLANTAKGTLGQPGLVEYMHLLFKDSIPFHEMPPGFSTLSGKDGESRPPDLQNALVKSSYNLAQINGGGLSTREKKAIEGLTLSSVKIDLASPAPIAPDYVAITLRNLTENYGPWKSQIWYSGIPRGSADIEIGGKTEYIKDENIAPWNFNGYDLMNTYARNLVNFDSEPALWIERGSFSVPDVPNSLNKIGTSLGGNALITNISTEVGVEGVISTYTLSTYTDTFGRMEKQKRDLIKKFASDRQKLQDQRNKAIRASVGKAQTSNTFPQEMQSKMPRYKVYSSTPSKSRYHTENGGQDVTGSVNNGSILNEEAFQTNVDAQASHPDQLNASLANTAIVEIGDDEIAISLEAGHGHMASIDDQQMSNIDYGDGLEGITNNEYNV